MPVFIHVETNVVNISFLMSYDDNLETSDICGMLLMRNSNTLHFFDLFFVMFKIAPNSNTHDVISQQQLTLDQLKRTNWYWRWRDVRGAETATLPEKGYVIWQNQIPGFLRRHLSRATERLRIGQSLFTVWKVEVWSLLKGVVCQLLDVW